MRSLLDDLLDKLNPDHGNVNEVCAAITEAVRQNPVGTSLWPMMIETRVKQQHLPLTVGRALLDAVEAFDSEKTLWMAPSGARQAAPVSTQAPALPVVTCNTETKQGIDVVDVLDNGVVEVSECIADAACKPRPAGSVRTAASMRQPSLGSVVNNRYLLERKLGHGCMGQVFIATDLAAENTGVADSRIILEVVAVDLHQQPESLTRLKDAVARIKGLAHPNIARVFGVEQADGQVSVAMEHLSGRWLADIIRQARKAPLPLATAWALIEGISNGLAYAHKQGMVHSNLNPCSIFVTDAGMPKIMGFELIDALPTSLEAIELLDTMTLRAYNEAYSADLIASRSSADPADDLYPLGVIAYELLTGKHPFQRHSLDAARQKCLSYAPIPNLPPRAAKLIADCLSFERNARPENAARFIKRMQGPTLLRWMFGDKYSALGV